MSAKELKRLITRAKRGNADAFRALVDEYKERLFAFVWRMVRDHHEAEDICQSVFVKAYEALDSYSDKYAFSTWLFTIAYRKTVNHLRKRKALSGDMDFANLPHATEDTADVVASSEEARRLRQRIWAAVDELTEAQKSAVLLFYREGKSCEEIGAVLRMPAVTVKSHLHRAREKLRQKLSTQLVDEPLAMEYLAEARLSLRVQ